MKHQIQSIWRSDCNLLNTGLDMVSALMLLKALPHNRAAQTAPFDLVAWPRISEPQGIIKKSAVQAASTPEATVVSPAVKAPEMENPSPGKFTWSGQTLYCISQKFYKIQNKITRKSNKKLQRKIQFFTNSWRMQIV